MLPLDAEPRARYTCTGPCGEEQLVWVGEPPEDLLCPDCRELADGDTWRDQILAAGVGRGTLRRALRAAEEDRRGALNPALEALSLMGVDGRPPILLLTGPTGVGKTSATVLHLAKIIQCYGLVVAYTTAPRLMLELRESYGRDLPSGVLSRYLRVPVLALDDIGTEQGTPHELTVLGQLIDDRLDKDLPTIVLSNLPLARPTRNGRVTESAPCLQDYDARWVSRVASGRVVAMEGEDHRLQRPSR